MHKDSRKIFRYRDNHSLLNIFTGKTNVKFSFAKLVFKSEI